MSNKVFLVFITCILILPVILGSCAPLPLQEEESTMVELWPDYANSRYKEIYLAGGCFWGVEAYFERILGVQYTNVGYANGDSESTDYYSIEKTGHAETIYLVYDPEILSLETILEYYYGIIEPTSLNKQGNDVGIQYRTGIYYVDLEDLETITLVTEREQERHREPIVTEIQELSNYVLAEDYHQAYLYKNPGGYCHVDLTNIPSEKPLIRASDYPKPSIEEIRGMLTDLQYKVTQENGTEPPFQNEYWDNEREGIYVDVVTGEPLFLSIDKYHSGTGWPSFTRPMDWKTVTMHRDKSMGVERVEVRSRSGDSHLGHVFTDRPADEGGLRFCINSSALRFVELGNMDENGYGKYMVYFQR